MTTGSDTGKAPRFSIVIPTRDRPEHVRNALTSALMQMYSDFEVVVCDNAKARPCREVVESFADKRVRYITPASPISMCDNWEFAVENARGDFVLVLIDKTMLRPSTLAHLSDAIASHPADIYSWTSDAFYLSNEADSVEKGYLVPVRGVVEPKYYDCKAELSRRLSFAQRLGTEGPNYCYGKICFGAFSKGLIARIKARFGRLFEPLAPDYTSMTVALMTADRLVDVGRSLVISTVTTISNGRLFTEDAVSGRRFLSETGFGAAEFETMPIPGVFCALHNLCAYDYRQAWLGKPGQTPFGALDLVNLGVEVDQDLHVIQKWASEDEKRAVGDRLNQFLSSQPVRAQRRFFDGVRHRLDAQLEAIKQREGHVKFREDYVLTRENNALIRENNALVRETNATDREQSLGRREQSINDRERIIAGYEGSLKGRIIRRVHQFEQRLRGGGAELQATAVSNVAQGSAEPAPPAAAAPPAAKPYAYPSFNSVTDALRFSESKGYTYPQPTLDGDEAGPET